MGLNKGQEKAVFIRNKDLMVSASAGTGKTYSLCQRVLKELKNGEKSIDRMLIVTFTNSAAAELRTKLAKELKKAIEEESDKDKIARLKKQKSLLPCAKICTIDSFCYELVRENFSRLNISPGVRIVDENELLPVKQKLMKSTVRNMYASSENGEAFAALMENLIDGYSDYMLYDKLIKLYEKTTTLVKGIACFQKAADDLRADAAKPFGESVCGSIIAGKNKRIFESCKNIVEWFLQNYSGMIGDTNFRNLNKQLEYIETGIRESGDPAAQIKALDGVKTDSYKQPAALKSDPGAMFFAAVRGDHINNAVRKPEARYLNFDVDRYAEYFEESAAQVECLYNLLAKYEDALQIRKKKMCVLEFSDVERLAYSLLCDENGEKKAFAKEYAEEFDELFIDEYQDVNEIQDRMFSALSRCNRFVVGDVKQSIYGFRGSKPEIFNELRGAYPDAKDDGNKTGKVFLEENFRSTKQILDFANAAIGPLMKAGGEIDYREEDDLKPALKEGTIAEGPLPALCFVQKDDPRYTDEENEEAAYLAESIERMIREGAKGGEIAVLARSNASVATVQKALAARGIASAGSDRDNVFETPEVLLLRSLMECVDNPTGDIALAGAMRSPVFGFTLDDLAAVRRNGRGESLFSALRDHTEKTGDARCQRVLAFLTDYRKRAREWPADTLVFRMMDDLMILPLLCAGKNPCLAERIKDNVLYFYDVVREIASSTGKDLGGIAAQIAELAKKDRRKDKNAPGVTGEQVRVMTIHASKGLEFPICWIFNAGAPLAPGKSSGIAFSSARGAAFKLRDKEFPWLKNNTPVCAAQKITDAEESVNEELRLLYVALTRAVKKLYISCTVTQKMKKTLDVLKGCPEELLSPFLLENNANYITWICLSAGAKSDLYKEYVFDLPFDGEAPEDGAKGEEKGAPDAACAVPDEVLTEEIRRRMEFVYPYGASVDLPAKKAVSQLSPAVLDDEAENEEEIDPAKFYAHLGVKPSFILEKEGKSGKTAAEIGSATHAFMQFCNFENLEKEGFEKEAERLVRDGFLSAAVAAIVEKDAVEGFLQSNLYAGMKKARKVFREQRFMIALPAAEFTSSDEKKRALAAETLLVQGVIDCFFEDENGELILFDYKTDHFTKKELKDRDACRKTLLDRHTRQLSYYREAIKRMMEKDVSHSYIYSFALSEAIGIDFSQD